MTATPRRRPSADRLQDLRRAIRRRIMETIGAEDGGRIQRARADDGYFGRGSVCWKVHGDFGPMMIGGVSALLLQMLHPAALAGVWDHSDRREDMSGRLRRTARFISGTTFGSKAEADGLIATVRNVHGRIAGVLPDGRRYSANDPALLTWVHVAEVSRFLAAYRRYCNPLLSRSDQDRYFSETALVAQKLGAEDVPTTRLAVEQYLESMRPRLLCDVRTTQIRSALLSQRAPNLSLAPLYAVMFEAGIDLLPSWARAMHGFAGRPIVRPGALAVSALARWAMTASTT